MIERAETPWSDPIGSDKHEWHRYSAFYRRHFATLGPVAAVLEFGVLNGASIRWLRHLFPRAEIVGVDILPRQPEWPDEPGIRYVQADQGDRPALERLPRPSGGGFDLVIDDGSHIPQHQAACLASVFPMVRPGGLYVLEDLHSSLAWHPLYLEHCAPGTPTALTVLLAIERLRAAGRALPAEDAVRLAAPGLFTAVDIARLDARIAEVELFRRASLPLRCWSCGSDAFDVVAFRCSCGISLSLADPDSMTAVLRAGGGAPPAG
jgi:predicted O-methyltransferase YrrM